MSDLDNENGTTVQRRTTPHQPRRSWQTWLIGRPLYAGLFAAQVLMYGLALAGSIYKIRWCGAPAVFVSLNLTTLRALADAATGRFNVKWKTGNLVSPSSDRRSP